MEKESASRSVETIEGVRRRDLTKFYGLKFKSSTHADIFVTPGQLKTIIAMRHEALELLKKLPKPPSRKWRERREEDGTEAKSIPGKGSGEG